jgi:hypothetical protein
VSHWELENRMRSHHNSRRTSASPSEKAGNALRYQTA